MPVAGLDRAEGRLTIRARELHAAIHDLLAQGKNYIQICQILGLTRNTVRKFARATTAGQVIIGPARARPA
jgi:DNA-binding CsgD family transcriptional regulator